MFGFDDSQLWPIAIGGIVFGLVLIGVAIYIAVAFVDWQAIKAARKGDG